MSPIPASISVKKSQWVKGIDTIRFFLAFVVILSHMENPLLQYKSSPSFILRSLEGADALMFNGAAAVITFFIISGFVIHFPNRKKDSSLNILSFLIRRFVRIGLPLALVILVANHFSDYGLIPVWSLYCELAYYALYTILFVLNISWKKIFILSFVTALCVACIFNFDDMLSFVHHKNIHYLGDYWKLGTLGTIIMGLPCWLLGVLLAEKIDSVHYEVSFKQLVGYRIGVWGISIILAAFRFHLFLGYMFTFNFFAFLLVRWLEKEIVYYKIRKHSAFLESLGKFSYTLYLWGNLFVQLFTVYIVYNLYTFSPILLLTIVSAYLLYLFTEYPAHKFAIRLAKTSERYFHQRVFQSRYQLSAKQEVVTENV